MDEFQAGEYPDDEDIYFSRPLRRSRSYDDEDGYTEDEEPMEVEM